MAVALIISSNTQESTHLSRILMQVSGFKKPDTVKDLEDGISKIEDEQHDFIFVSSQFGLGNIAEFIEMAKGFYYHNKPTFVLLTKPSEQTDANISQNMVAGVHGFLCEPHTQESLEEVIHIAGSFNTIGTRARLRAASGLMLSKMIEESDACDSDGNKIVLPKDPLARVKESCIWFKKITGESASMVMLDSLKEEAPAQRLQQYDGVSERVKSLVENIFREKLSFFNFFSKDAGAE